MEREDPVATAAGIIPECGPSGAPPGSARTHRPALASLGIRDAVHARRRGV